MRVGIGPETFEATLGAYGGRTFLGLRKPLLTALGLSAGDLVHVELEPAPLPDEPEPEPGPTTCVELAEALTSDQALSAAYQQLPASHRDEYARWISNGADAATRESRIARLRARLLPQQPGRS